MADIPGISGYRQALQDSALAQHTDAQQAQVGMGLLQAIQQQQQAAALRDALAKGDTAALSRIPGGIDILGKLQAQQTAGTTQQLNQARLTEINQKMQDQQGERQARGALANLLTPSGSFGQGTPAENPNAQVFGSDAEAIAAMQKAEAAGQPFTGNVPNPANVRALTIAAGNSVPRGTAADLFKTMAGPKDAAPSPLAKLMAEKQALAPNDPRHAMYDAAITHATNPGGQNARQERLLPVQQPDGSVVYTPESEARGQKVGGRTTDQNISKQVQALGTAFEKAGLPTTNIVVKDAEAAVANADILNYLTGAGALKPDIFSSKEVTDARQAIQKLFNITLKDRSGAAVTNQEMDRLKAEFGAGVFKKPEQLQTAVARARTIVDNHFRNIAAGYGPKALEMFNQNLEDIGGTPLLQGGASSAPPAVTFPAANGWSIRPAPVTP